MYTKQKLNLRIVILGGGFAGIHTYKSLPSWVRNCSHITLVDKKNHFLFTPLLPEVAGSTLGHHNVVLPLRDVISRDTHFIQSSVVSVDTKKQLVVLENQELSYDILISGLGAKTHFFGTPGAEEYAYILKTLKDATVIRNRIIDLFERASATESEIEKKKLLTFMVIGAGPTGVELVTEVADLIYGTLIKQHNNISIDDVSITVVNGGDQILGMFHEKMRQYAESVLVRNHIQVKNGVRVEEIKKGSAITADGQELYANTIIWTAGVTANSLPCECGAFDVERGRIKVNEYLQALGTENVFVLGDMALYPTDDGRGLPMTAQIAKQQGELTGKNIARLIKKQELKKFVYREKGLLTSLGSGNAIAQVGPVRLHGVVAWLFWRFVYLYTFKSGKKRFKIMMDWFVGLFARKDTSLL